MIRRCLTCFLVMAIVLAVVLPGAVQAKRFKRYPSDKAEEKSAERTPAPAAEPADGVEDEGQGEYEFEEPEEMPGLLGFWGHGGGGITVEYIYTGDTFNNMRGGVNTSGATEYQGLFNLAITADLDTYGCAPGGTVFILAESFHGRGLGAHVGDAQGVMNTEAGRQNFQVSEFWWEKSLCDGLISVRIGKQDANADHAYVELAGDFIQSSFGLIPTVPMPVWPDPALGITTFFELTEWLDFSVGVYDGAADGRTWGVSGTGDIFSIYQLKTAWALACDTLPGDASVGLWYHDGDFDEPGSDGAITHSGSHGLYLGFEQLLCKENRDPDDDQGLGGFVQAGFAPASRAEIAKHLGAGLVYKGLLACRDDDITGVGIAVAYFSDRMALPEDETVVEFFYKIPLTPYIMIQPDVQYIASPSGVERDAMIIGLRFEAVL